MTKPTDRQIEAVEDVLRGLVIITGDSTWDFNYVAKAVLAAAAEARGEDDRDPYARHPKAIADNVSEIERLRTALEAVLADIAEYERVNNLSPSPGREFCWDSVARARKALKEKP